MICPICGGITPDRSNFCTMCGANLQFVEKTPPIYTKNYICEKLGHDELAERDFSFDGIKCKKYWSSKQPKSLADKLSFYVFKSESDARAAFNYMGKAWFRKDSYRDENSIEGINLNVYDAYITEYAFVKGNMIIEAELSVKSAWISPRWSITGEILEEEPHNNTEDEEYARKIKEIIAAF